MIEIRGHDPENKNLIIIKALFFEKERKANVRNFKSNNKFNSVWRVQAIQILANYFKSRGENKKSKEYLELLKPLKLIK